MSILRKILLAMLLFAGTGFVSAQDPVGPNQLNQQLVSARIQTLRDAGSQEGGESPIAAYEQVLNWLGEAEAHAAAEKTYLDAINTAPQIESEIRKRMDTKDYSAPGTDTASVTKLNKSKIEEKLTALRVELGDTNTNKDNLDRRIATERSSAPNIQARFEAIDTRLQELPTTVINIELGLQPSQFEASEWSVLAERSVLVAERRSLEARLSSQPVRYSRRKAESDEFTLIINGLQLAIQTMVAELATRLENLETKTSISLDENASGYGFVQQLTEENAQLRLQRTELATILSALKDEDLQIDQEQLSLKEQFDAVQQIVDLAQNSSSLGHVLMAHWHQADSFNENLAELSSTSDIGGHVIQRAAFEERQAVLSTTAIMDEMEPGANEAMVEAAKDRIRKQRGLLVELIAMETEIINKQGSIDRTHHLLGLNYHAYQRYLSSRILWVPSHPPISLSSLKAIGKESSNLFESLANLRMASFTPITSLLLVIIFISFALRKRTTLYLHSLSTKVGRARDDSIRYTFRALLLALIRSTATPLLLLILASGLENAGSGASPYLAASLIHAAEILFLILLLRVVCEENGIAQAHFGWTQTACMSIRNLCTSLLIWWWPLALLTSFLLKIEVDSISAVFGRLFFIIHISILGKMLFKFIWSESLGGTAYRRWRIVGSGIVASTTVFFIFCCIFGYIYTGSIVYNAWTTSLIIVTGLVFLYYIMQRWLLVTRRRLRFQELLAARQATDDERERAAESEETDLVTLSASVSKLLTFATLALAMFSLAYVWAPLFRALEAMQRITLWTVSDMSEGEAILTSVTLATVVWALLIGLIIYIAARNVPPLISLLLRSSKHTTPGSRYAINKLLGYFIVALGFMIFLSTLGVRWDRLQWLVAALGVGIGFGLQEIIANFISGLLILFERPIRVGDVITVGESSGRVVRIQIRATTIRDFDGKELLVPNKEFVTGRLLNWTLSNTNIRMKLDVGIAYGSDVRKAMSIVESLLEKHELVLDSPEPSVIFREFGDSSLVMSARYFFSDVEQRGYLLSDLHLKINDAFAEAGIVIAFPQIDVHMDAPQSSLSSDGNSVPGGTLS